MKVFCYLLAELFFIAFGGCIGAWLPFRNIPAGAGGPGDGMGMFLFGTAGLFAGGMVGVLGLVSFWSVMEMRAKAITDAADRNIIVFQDDITCPPSPRG